MIGMGEMVGSFHQLIQSTSIAHYNFWGDIGLLLIDHLEWVSIIVGTEKFVVWLRKKRK